MGKTQQLGTLVNGLTVDANGNVGIATTPTTDRLTISGNTTVLGSVNVSSYQYFTSIYGGYIFGYTGTTYTPMTYSASYHSFSTSGTEKLRITNSGNVGIGTSSPSYKLEIGGDTSQSIGISSTNTSISNNTPYSSIQFRSYGGLYNQVYGYPDAIIQSVRGNRTYNGHQSTHDADLVFSTNPNNNGSDAIERVRICSNGNVGIGTNSPVSALEVFNDSNWTGGWRANLTVTANDYPTIRLKANNSGKIAFIGNNGDGSLYFNVNASESGSNAWAMVMSPAGNVSIGSTADIGTKLQVNGANYIEMAQFAATTGSAQYLISANSGYVQFSTARYSSNSSLFVPVSDGIKITKAGILYITVSQDITTAGNTSYVSFYIRKNGNTFSENLITNTNGQWDGLNAAGVIDVAVNDVIGFYVSANDITSFDPTGWSQYCFLWAAR